MTCMTASGAAAFRAGGSDVAAAARWRSSGAAATRRLSSGRVAVRPEFSGGYLAAKSVREAKLRLNMKEFGVKFTGCWRLFWQNFPQAVVFLQIRDLLRSPYDIVVSIN